SLGSGCNGHWIHLNLPAIALLSGKPRTSNGEHPNRPKRNDTDDPQFPQRPLVIRR
ncbi:hypothetical protein FS749_011219, partial [Ceratobasidium sp. UAMH 11750]